MGPAEAILVTFSVTIFVLALVLAVLWIIMPFAILSIKGKVADQCRQFDRIIGLLEAQARQPAAATAPIPGGENQPAARANRAGVVAIAASSPGVRAF